MSYGEAILEKYLKCMIREPFLKNHRPDWLKGLELDFFFPERRIGIEFQGDHHYVQTSYSNNLKAVELRDSQKRILCGANGVLLISLDAIDLEYTRLRHKLKKIKFWKLIDLNRQLLQPLRTINKEATEYRSNLKSKFKSPTAYRKSNLKRIELQYGKSLADKIRRDREVGARSRRHINRTVNRFKREQNEKQKTEQS